MATTIFAPATGVGRAAVAIIRISGPSTAAALTTLAGSPPPPRVATLRALRHPVDATLLDRALVLWFPGPNSFTGEDCAELHCHGGRAVVSALLKALSGWPDCRLAEPGEFTRRALLNGRMDLPAVEGLADLIDAETEAQRRQAQRQLDGVLGLWVAAQRDRLLQAMAAAESAIDFSDEGDVAGDFAREVQHHVGVLLAAVQRQLSTAATAARQRDGLVVTLAGPPNAGKSTLLNMLAQRDVAIVSPHAGTTRDPIEVQLDLGGALVLVIDTAGLRATDDPVEQQGIDRARARAKAADLVLWLSEAACPAPPADELGGKAVWRIVTKIDLAPATVPADFHIAASVGDGVRALVDALTHFASTAVADDGGVITRERHRAALEDVAVVLSAFQRVGSGMPIELAAEQLRMVSSRLDSLVGRVETEEVLGAIFSRFCIGK